MKPTLFITSPLPKPVIDRLEDFFSITLNPENRVLEKQELINHLKDKEALLCLLTDNIDKEVLQAAPKLKMISNYAVGFNNIDIIEANARKIPVCIAAGTLTDTTADLAFGLILASTRRLVEADAFTRLGKFKGWKNDLFLGADVYGKTLGIIGMGRIGQAVAKRAQGFDMKILYTAHADKNLSHAQFVSLLELLKEADIISIHAPLTKETHHLIDESQFKLMKKTAFIINTARGSIINEQALVNALKDKIIAGAGLDVYEHEPLITAGLTELENVVLLPHIASATVETRLKTALLAAENLISLLKGKTPNVLANPEIFTL